MWFHDGASFLVLSGEREGRGRRPRPSRPYVPSQVLLTRTLRSVAVDVVTGDEKSHSTVVGAAPEVSAALWMTPLASVSIAAVLVHGAMVTPVPPSPSCSLS